MSSGGWAIARGEEDGRPLLFRYRDKPPISDLTRFPYLISVLWQYQGDATGGMPDDDTLANMDDMEDAVLPIDGSDNAFLMAVITGNNHREWLWYAADAQTFSWVFNEALRGKPKFPLDLQATADPEWLTYLSIRESMG